MTDSIRTSFKSNTDRRVNPGFLIRRASVGDARAIAEVAVLGWRAAYRGILPGDFLTGLSVRAREIAWQAMLESDPEGCAPAWVAERDGRVVGFVSSGPPRDEDVPLSAAEVYAIYVMPADWGMGVGRALLDAVTAHWRGRGATELVLWVLEANDAARAFYGATGWRPDGSRQRLRIAGLNLAEVRLRRPSRSAA